MYKDMLDNSNYKDLVAKAKTISDEIKKREDIKNSNVDLINKNPWLSEAARRELVGKEIDNYSKAIQPLTNEYERIDNLLKEMKNSAKDDVLMAYKDLGLEEKINEDKLNYYLDKINKEIELKADAIKQQQQEAQRLRYTTPKTFTIGNNVYRWKYNDATGEWKKVLVGTKPSTSSKKTTKVKPFWTTTDYKKLSFLGVPRSAADTISVGLQEGISPEALKQAFLEKYGKIKGSSYVDKVISYLKKAKETTGFK